MSGFKGEAKVTTSTSLRVEESKIKGCARVCPQRINDVRGTFVKVFQESALAALNEHPGSISWKEVFYSQSRKNVIRGFHVMGPPAEGFKLVTVVEGAILDVVLDLRVGSPTEMQTCDWHLCAGDAVLVAPGVAHGFCVLSDFAIVAYLVSAEYHESADLGVRWDSVGFHWPCQAAVVSERDRHLPSASEFVSPFQYST